MNRGPLSAYIWSSFTAKWKPTFLKFLSQNPITFTSFVQYFRHAPNMYNAFSNSYCKMYTDKQIVLEIIPTQIFLRFFKRNVCEMFFLINLDRTGLYPKRGPRYWVSCKIFRAPSLCILDWRHWSKTFSFVFFSHPMCIHVRVGVWKATRMPFDHL